jgi:hypothetical protein
MQRWQGDVLFATNKSGKEGCEKMLELEAIKNELDDEAEKLRELGESL